MCCISRKLDDDLMVWKCGDEMFKNSREMEWYVSSMKGSISFKHTSASGCCSNLEETVTTESKCCVQTWDGSRMEFYNLEGEKRLARPQDILLKLPCLVSILLRNRCPFQVKCHDRSCSNSGCHVSSHWNASSEPPSRPFPSHNTLGGFYEWKKRCWDTIGAVPASQTAGL